MTIDERMEELRRWKMEEEDKKMERGGSDLDDEGEFDDDDYWRLMIAGDWGKNQGFYVNEEFGENEEFGGWGDVDEAFDGLL